MGTKIKIRCESRDRMGEYVATDIPNNEKLILSQRSYTTFDFLMKYNPRMRMLKINYFGISKYPRESIPELSNCAVAWFDQFGHNEYKSYIDVHEMSNFDYEHSFECPTGEIVTIRRFLESSTNYFEALDQLKSLDVDRILFCFTE